MKCIIIQLLLFGFFLSWVVFEEPGFCGESYILEKGLYGSPEDWGALQHCIGSTMPILLVRAVTLTAWIKIKSLVIRRMHQ